MVTIHYRAADPARPLRTLEVRRHDPNYARALWLAEITRAGAVLDCTVTEVPSDARVGEAQDPRPYCSPLYLDEPTVDQVLEDEERRRRFVTQARRVAIWLGIAELVRERERAAA